MRESHGPVDRMAAALDRMMRALARHARALERLRSDGGAAAGGAAGTAGIPGTSNAAAPALRELEQCREALEREIAICIESLQFHDRLMQQLAQVRTGLTTAGAVAQPPSELRLSDGAAGSVELF